MNTHAGIIRAGLLFWIALHGCSADEPSFKVGGLYSVKDGKNGFKIAKVLVAEKDMIHLRLYKNTFAARPTQVVPADLSLGSIKDKDGFGMGHLPLDLQTFRSWEPVFLMESTVTGQELDGYNLWKDANGGAFK